MSDAHAPPPSAPAGETGSETGSGENRLHPGCRASRDGECSWSECPQLRDDEPTRSGRHCPLDTCEGRECFGDCDVIEHQRGYVWPAPPPSASSASDRGEDAELDRLLSQIERYPRSGASLTAKGNVLARVAYLRDKLAQANQSADRWSERAATAERALGARPHAGEDATARVVLDHMAEHFGVLAKACETAGNMPRAVAFYFARQECKRALDDSTSFGWQIDLRAALSASDTEGDQTDV